MYGGANEYRYANDVTGVISWIEDKKKWNSIVNKTPLFARTNRIIGDKSPSDYIFPSVRFSKRLEKLVEQAYILQNFKYKNNVIFL